MLFEGHVNHIAVPASGDVFASSGGAPATLIPPTSEVAPPRHAAAPMPPVKNGFGSNGAVTVGDGVPGIVAPKVEEVDGATLGGYGGAPVIRVSGGTASPVRVGPISEPPSRL